MACHERDAKRRVEWYPMEHMSVTKNTRLLLALFCASLLLSIPSILRAPRFAPFLQAEVRDAAPKALDLLRSGGLWLVNVDLRRVEKKEDMVCFTWTHQYSSRDGKDSSEDITTCVAP